MSRPTSAGETIAAAPLTSTPRRIRRERAGQLGGPSRSPRRASDVPEHELPVPMLATDEEVIRAKRFDALAPEELAAALPR